MKSFQIDRERALRAGALVALIALTVSFLPELLRRPSPPAVPPDVGFTPAETDLTDAAPPPRRAVPAAPKTRVKAARPRPRPKRRGRARAGRGRTHPAGRSAAGSRPAGRSAGQAPPTPAAAPATPPPAAAPAPAPAPASPSPPPPRPGDGSEEFAPR